MNKPTIAEHDMKRRRFANYEAGLIADHFFEYLAYEEGRGKGGLEDAIAITGLENSIRDAMRGAFEQFSEEEQ